MRKPWTLKTGAWWSRSLAKELNLLKAESKDAVKGLNDAIKEPEVKLGNNTKYLPPLVRSGRHQVYPPQHQGVGVRPFRLVKDHMWLELLRLIIWVCRGVRHDCGTALKEATTIMGYWVWSTQRTCQFNCSFCSFQISSSWQPAKPRTGMSIIWTFNFPNCYFGNNTGYGDDNFLIFCRVSSLTRSCQV